MTDLASKVCAACNGDLPRLTDHDIKKYQAKLDPAWTLDDQNMSLTREFTFKGFAKATYTANLAAFISDREGHHADIAFGWGYCKVTFTSHELGGLSENDFICAAKIDRALE